MCFSVTLTERWRRVFGLITTVTNMVILFLSLALLVAGIAIRIKLDNRLELLEDYNPGALPIFLMVTACLLFLTHLVACKFCYAATYVASRSSKHHLFVALIVVITIITVYLFVCLIVTLVHSAKISGAVRKGMEKSMKLYKSDIVRKQRVDAVQVEFECCGVDSFNDWLSIPWVNMAFVNVQSPDVKPYIKDGEYIKDDVPFSCCSSYAKRACVHHSIKTGTAHRNYLTGDTLYPEGCVAVMTSHFHSSLIAPTAILILVILIIQIVTITLMRLLQTSIENADEMNDPEGEGVAYCLRSLGKGGDVRDYLKRKTSDVDERDIEKGGRDDGDDDIGNGDDDDDDDDEDDDTKELGGSKRPWKDARGKRSQDNDVYHDAIDDDKDRTPWGFGTKQTDTLQPNGSLKRPFDKGHQYNDQKKMKVKDNGKEAKRDMDRKTGGDKKGMKTSTDEKKGKKKTEDPKNDKKKQKDIKKDKEIATDVKMGKKDGEATKKKEEKPKKDKGKKKEEIQKKKEEKQKKKDEKLKKKGEEKKKKEERKKKDKAKKKDKKVKPPKKIKVKKPKKPKKMKSPKKKKSPKGKKKK